MRKVYSIFILLLTVSSINSIIAQTTPPLYHPNDLTKLKTFLEQSSENNPGHNLLIVWDSKNGPAPDLPLAASGEGWADKLLGVKWDDKASNRQLLDIDWGENFTQSSFIGDLNLSDCQELRRIICTENNLRTIKINNDAKLEEVICFDNKLISIQISNNPNLTKLNCSHNFFSTLEIGTNPALIELNCTVNDSLKNLDLSKNTALKKLNCSQTSIQSLNLIKNVALEELFCVKTKIKSLDLTQNSALRVLYCPETDLTTLDLSKNIALEKLSCSQTKIKTLDVSNNINLKDLFCSDMPMESLNLSGAQKLQLLHCRHTLLTTLDVSKNAALKELNCESTPLKSINLNGATALTDLSLSRTALSSLDASKNKNLKNIYCGYAPLESINVSGLTQLETLYCNFTFLSSLDVSTNKILTSLYCRRAFIPFSKLPPIQPQYANYDYCKQETFKYSTSWENTIDMTKFLCNNKTVFTWYLSTDTTKALTDIQEIQDGLFTVTEKYAGTKLLCKMTNSDFSQFSDKFEVYYPEYTLLDTRMTCEVDITKTMVNTTEKINQSVKVYSQNGTLYIETNKPSQVAIYTSIGKLKEMRKISEGTNTFSLSSGFYIVKVNNQVFKCQISSN